MFFAIKEERKSKKSKYFWHISLLLLFLWRKFRNYFRYLQTLEQLFYFFNARSDSLIGKQATPTAPMTPNLVLPKNEMGVMGVVGATQKVDMTIYACVRRM